MRQCYFAGLRATSPSYEGDVRGSVVRRADGRSEDQRAFSNSRDRMNGCYLEYFFKAKFWKDAGESFGEHGLPCPRRTPHGDVVSAGGGDDQSSFGGFLSADVIPINFSFRVLLLAPKPESRLWGAKCRREKVLQGKSCSVRRRLFLWRRPDSKARSPNQTQVLPCGCRPARATQRLFGFCFWANRSQSFL